MRWRVSTGRETCHLNNGRTLFKLYPETLFISTFLIAHLILPFAFTSSSFSSTRGERSKVYLRKHNEERVRNSSCYAHDMKRTSFFIFCLFFHSPVSPRTSRPLFIRYCGLCIRFMISCMWNAWRLCLRLYTEFLMNNLGPRLTFSWERAIVKKVFDI